jgi:hypothetical protein
MTSLINTLSEMKVSVTSIIAASAVASPAWLPWLQTVSVVAATIMPILGVIYLSTQIIQAWTKKKR